MDRFYLTIFLAYFKDADRSVFQQRQITNKLSKNKQFLLLLFDISHLRLLPLLSNGKAGPDLRSFLLLLTHLMPEAVEKINAPQRLLLVSNSLFFWISCIFFPAMAG